MLWLSSRKRRVAFSIALSALCTLGACKNEPPTAAPPKAQETPKEAASLAPATLTTPKKAATDATSKLIEQLDATIARHQKRQSDEARSWVEDSAIAQTYLARARFSGDLQDFIKAKAALDRAMSKAPDQAKPYEVLASYQFSVHQFDQALESVERAKKSNDRADLNALNGLEADIYFQRGELERAKALYEQLAQARPDLANLSRLGHYALKTGDPDLARERYDGAIDAGKQSAAATHSIAWAQLMRGIVELESGQHEEARAFFYRADQTMPGWYLIEEHLAETYKLLGKLDLAIEQYKKVLAKNPAGEFQDAMAECYALKGDEEEAARWRALASASFKRDIEILPSAAYGHALDHFLEGEDKERALQLATQNHELRPGPEPKLKLAQALINLERYDQARQLIDQVSKTPYRTPDYYLLQATVLTHEGKADEAKQAQAQALKLNPSSK